MAGPDQCEQPDYVFAAGPSVTISGDDIASGWRATPKEIWVDVYRGMVGPDGATVWDDHPVKMRAL